MRSTFPGPALTGPPGLALALTLALALALAGCAGPAPRISAAATATAAAQARGTCSAAPPPARYRHVVWIWFENKPYDAVLGSGQAPYLTALGRGCAVATDYHGVSHPSLPNYLAATGGSDHGISDDGPPSEHPLSGPSLFGQVAAAGGQWRSYQESMPRPCLLHDSDGYAVKHDPAAYYTALRAACPRADVPLTALGADVAAGQLPQFALVTPDLCHDTHDCPVATGDQWLQQTLPGLLDGPNYRSGDTVVFVTWDEDDDHHDNHVPLLVLAPSVTPGTRLTARADHYTLLRTTEQLLGLAPLGAAGRASPLPVPVR